MSEGAPYPPDHEDTRSLPLQVPYCDMSVADTVEIVAFHFPAVAQEIAWASGKAGIDLADTAWNDRRRLSALIGLTLQEHTADLMEACDRLAAASQPKTNSKPTNWRPILQIPGDVERRIKHYYDQTQADVPTKRREILEQRQAYTDQLRPHMQYFSGRYPEVDMACQLEAAWKQRGYAAAAQAAAAVAVAGVARLIGMESAVTQRDPIAREILDRLKQQKKWQRDTKYHYGL